MADLKKLQIGGAVSMVSAVKIDDKDIGPGGGDSKIWHTVELGNAEFRKLDSAGQLSVKLDREYDPENFANDYIRVICNTKPQSEGQIIDRGEQIKNVRVDLKSGDWVASSFHRRLADLMNHFGFNYHYYNHTAVLFAGCSEEEKAEGGIRILNKGDDLFKIKDIVIVQDVTAQTWESKLEVLDNKLASVNVIDKIAIDEKGLESEDYDNVYVLHVAGASGSTGQELNFMFCYYDTKAPYWDATTNKLDWVEIEGGKVYTCKFDFTGTGTHNTERWLVDVTGTTTKEPVEATSAQLDALYNNGYDFTQQPQQTSNVFLATAIQFDGGKAAIAGVDAGKLLAGMFSINKEFVEPQAGSRYNIQVIGRPIGYRIASYTYPKPTEEGEEPEYITETEGEYIWSAELEGMSFALIIPDSNKKVAILEAVEDAEEETLYRHTFTLTGGMSETETGSVYMTFGAVNAQAGDSSIDYILYSDQGEQGDPDDGYFDWVLPASGVYQPQGSAAGDPWFPIMKVMAGWAKPEGHTAWDERVLYIQYINTTSHQLIRVAIVNSENRYAFGVKDFQSKIGSYLTNASSSDLRK